MDSGRVVVRGQLGLESSKVLAGWDIQDGFLYSHVWCLGWNGWDRWRLTRHFSLSVQPLYMAVWGFLIA